uniref:Uncharacterized protein n=1 Tax=Anguilla anguilla TaxID=7936 RepID=A0A0E9VH33_ANGAN
MVAQLQLGSEKVSIQPRSVSFLSQ